MPGEADRGATDKADEGAREQIVFCLASAGIGLALYTVGALLVAAVIVNGFPSRHGHAMDALLYIFLPLLGAPMGTAAGATIAIRMRNRSYATMLRLLALTAAALSVIGVIIKPTWDWVERM